MVFISPAYVGNTGERKGGGCFSLSLVHAKSSLLSLPFLQLAGRLSARPQSPGLPRCSDRRSDTVLAEPRSLLPLSEERRGSLHPECLSRVLDFERKGRSWKLNFVIHKL